MNDEWLNSGVEKHRAFRTSWRYRY